MILLLFTNDNAPVAELADAQRSGRCMGFHVQVRILFGALVRSGRCWSTGFLFYS